VEKVILLTGGNRGNRKDYLAHALFFIGQKTGFIYNQSAIYETEPWGFEDQTPFLNQAILLETKLNPYELLKEIQSIEVQLGRQRNGRRYSSRTIDIDIIFFGERIISDNNLIIPHPRLQERRFALAPVYEISPDWWHPLLKKSVCTLYHECTDNHFVKKYS